MEPPVTTAVVIPVKSFDLAKERLADAVDPATRAEMARTMAEGVVAAGAPLPVFVVCGAPDVATWALGVGAGVIWQRTPGLNPAIELATDVLAADGYRRVIVAHGDLPLATELAFVADFDGVTIVPDRRGDGTNVMAVPVGTGFRFRYGVGSAAAHRAEAERCGLACRTIEDDQLGLDVDTPDDLAALAGRDDDRMTRGAS